MDCLWCPSVFQMRSCRNVIMQELDAALASQAPAQHNENSALHELPPLNIDGIPTPVDKMTQVGRSNWAMWPKVPQMQMLTLREGEGRIKKCITVLFWKTLEHLRQKASQFTLRKLWSGSRRTFLMSCVQCRGVIRALIEFRWGPLDTLWGRNLLYMQGGKSVLFFL